MKNPPATFEEIKRWAWNYWGLSVRRADPTNPGRCAGLWRTGFILSGDFPGRGHTARRFNTLTALAKALDYGHRN